VDRHREWLLEKIQHVVIDGSTVQEVDNDMLIVYLSDNSPDLLMNLLGCIDLTERHFSNAAADVSPAMLNVRWTPLEMARVLTPKRGDGEVDRSANDSTSCVTILLYGDGYENAAAEAVDFISNVEVQVQHHHAVALPIPNFTLDRQIKIPTIKDQSGLHNSLLNLQSSGHRASTTDAILLFTSGTSSALGIPKGVRLSHRSLFVQAYAKTQSPCGYDNHTVVAANTVPLFHIGGLSSLLAVLLGGGSLVFPCFIGGSSSKGFRPEMVLESLCSQNTTTMFTGVNTLVVVPAMLHSIFEHIGQDRNSDATQSFPHVRLILVGGQSIGSGQLYSQTRHYFPNAKIVQTYACTEAGSSITFEDLGYKNDGDSKPDSDEVVAIAGGATCVGLPPAHIHVGIFGTEQSLLPHGEMGIIGTRGQHTMLGYWNRGDNKKIKTTVHSDDEWTLTSDLGYIHPRNGKLFFCGRANDVIRTGGESVLSTEVETVLSLHPDISEVTVFALPDKKFGEAICAAVVLKNAAVSDFIENAELRDTFRQHCSKHHLAGLKRPRRVFIMPSLPRNSSGKILKQKIAKMCSQSLTTKSRL
jgi:acyl-CoA synthetase (AMP-forming)/AMP-acid ligase II